MPSRSDIFYFGAGPAPLPTQVLERASSALLNYADKGIGICEISHRSPEANAILADAKAAMTQLYDIPDDYDILFLQGGGSGEFSAVVHNLVAAWVEKRRAKAAAELGEDKKDEILARLRKEVAEELRADYLVTGSWSLKASQEAARLMGAQHVNVAVDARKANNGKFGTIPAESEWALNKRAAYVYYCDNETVDGVEMPGFPASLEGEDAPPVVADMSSNFISRKIDVRKYSVIFGGAQKNIGNAGITIVIVKKALLAAQASADLLRQLNLPIAPIVFDWPTIAKNNSLYNTLPIFDVWVAGQVMQGLVQAFGVQKIAGQESVANQKAELLYSVLDRYPDAYRVVPHKSARSRMNLCFRVHGGDDAKEKEFLAGAEKRGLTGLKGHRSVGGIRISNYNAVPVEGAQKLAQYLEDYAKGL
ncbi:Phosphoserine aminotransferase [Lasiodiplodia theobromae]|uniref:Phosphoserine aminotransferase n=1 Tax=Lasiodiplodia theobromae TaxID=45133 RepID=UPI0015C3A9F8|nr:Phosphoserine aminotransferase [Lasiodiplodia theobromae]KAF4546080.1 Phosphoserine aminotransferase [Lasiodiplodia theobromae]